LAQTHREEISMRWKLGRVAIGLGLLMALGSVITAGAQDGANAERGGELYVAYCAGCHGIDGQGRVGASLESFPGIRVGAALASTIANGVPGSVMPAWAAANGGPLSDQDIADLAGYIQGAFDGTEPIRPAPTYQPPVIPPLPDVDGDPTRGAIVYHESCAPCHGEQGQGVFGYTLAKDWPANDPHAYLRSVVAAGIAGTQMPAWGLVNGGPLSDQQIADVAAYVLTFDPISPAAPPPVESVGPLGRPASLLILGGLLAAAILALALYYRRA
jgi:mono/diheme cytochrome c family protein